MRKVPTHFTNVPLNAQPPTPQPCFSGEKQTSGDWQLGKLIGAWRTFDLFATETLTLHSASALAKLETSAT